MKDRSISLAVFLTVALLFPALLPADQVGSGFAVVELFTSEGCSSCPPADEALSQLILFTREKGLPIYVLEWHVDYWDYLGWKDPWDSRFATDRQYAYARSLPSSVYTPQAVINGQAVARYAGDLHELEELAGSFAAHPPQSSIRLTQAIMDSPGTIRAHIDVTSAPPGAVVLLAEVEQGLSATPNAGENAGRTLVHSNVVRAVKVVPAAGGDIVLSVPKATPGKTRGLIALLEDSGTMHILAAAGSTAAGENELSGRIIDDKDRPVPGVLIQACSASLCIPARSDGQGYFTLRGVPAGRYELDFDLPTPRDARVQFCDHASGIVVEKSVWHLSEQRQSE
jgi:hypothetical protein